MKKNKKKVLLVCSKGLNRSRYLAEYLRRKGYSTKYGGVERFSDGTGRKSNYISQEMVNWAETIVLVRKRLKDVLKKKYIVGRKKIIVLEVTDSPRLIPEKYAYLRQLDFREFNRKWTRPQLRKAIKPYLPL